MEMKEKKNTKPQVFKTLGWEGKRGSQWSESVKEKDPPQLISATTNLDQISPSLCLYCVSMYGLVDFPLSLWLFYYVLQSCSGGGGRLLDWVVVACYIGRWIQVKR